MNLTDILNRSLFKGYASSDIGAASVVACIFFTALIACYIFAVYRRMNRNSFYNRSYNVSLIGMALITAAIVLTIQSNIVVSLGMVGALSIVRFRTAVKDPMDLVFLYWSISVGIICGAGFAVIAAVLSAVVTLVLIICCTLPDAGNVLVLVVNSSEPGSGQSVAEAVKAHTKYMKTRARTVTGTSLNIVYEIRSEEEAELLDAVMSVPGVLSASLVEHDGEVTV